MSSGRACASGVQSRAKRAADDDCAMCNVCVMCVCVCVVRGTLCNNNDDNNMIIAESVDGSRQCRGI